MRDRYANLVFISGYANMEDVFYCLNRQRNSYIFPSTKCSAVERLFEFWVVLGSG